MTVIQAVMQQNGFVVKPRCLADCPHLSHKLLRELKRGAGTIPELAALTELTPRQVNVGIWVLTSSGQAESTGRAICLDHDGGCKGHNIYALTRKGKRKARRVSLGEISGEVVAEGQGLLEHGESL